MPEMGNIISRDFGKLRNEWIVLIEANSEDISGVVIDILKAIIGKKNEGVIVSASRPFINLVSILKEKDIDIKKLSFIDCVTQPTGEKTERPCTFVQTSANLTEISIALEESSKNFKGDGFFLIDSISSMLIYNDRLTLTRFFHSLFVRMRTKKISGAILMMREDNNIEVRAEIGQLCDKIIKLYLPD